MNITTFIRMSNNKPMTIAGLAAGGSVPVAFMFGYMLSSPLASTKPISSFGMGVYIATLILPPFIALFASFIVLKLFRYRLPFTASLAGIGCTFLVFIAIYIILVIIAELFANHGGADQGLTSAQLGFDPILIAMALVYIATSTICFRLIGMLNERATLPLGAVGGLMLAIYAVVAYFFAIVSTVV